MYWDHKYIIILYTPPHLVDCIMRQNLNFCMYTQLLDDAKMQSRTTLSLPYLITQMYFTFMSDTESNVCTPSCQHSHAPPHVNIVMKYISMTYILLFQRIEIEAQ